MIYKVGNKEEIYTLLEEAYNNGSSYIAFLFLDQVLKVRMNKDHSWNAHRNNDYTQHNLSCVNVPCLEANSYNEHTSQCGKEDLIFIQKELDKVYTFDDVKWEVMEIIKIMEENAYIMEEVYA
jgi:hypothetical protein